MAAAATSSRVLQLPRYLLCSGATSDGGGGPRARVDERRETSGHRRSRQRDSDLYRDTHRSITELSTSDSSGGPALLIPHPGAHITHTYITHLEAARTQPTASPQPRPTPTQPGPGERRNSSSGSSRERADLKGAAPPRRWAPSLTQFSLCSARLHMHTNDTQLSDAGRPITDGRPAVRRY